jgi:Family of unknown function (DUF6364)
MKNITLSVDEATLKKAREAARHRGRSLNALIREYLEELAGAKHRARAVANLRRLWAEGGGHSGGRKIKREEAYEGRV